MTRRFPRRSRTRSNRFKRRTRSSETTTTSTTRPRRRRIRNEKRKRRFTSPRGGSRTHDWSPPTSSPPSPRSRRRVWSPRTHAPRAPWWRWSPRAAAARRGNRRARALEPGPGGGRRGRGGRDARCCRRARDAGGDRERGGFEHVEHGRIDLVHGSSCRSRARGGGGRAGSGVWRRGGFAGPDGSGASASPSTSKARRGLGGCHARLDGDGRVAAALAAATVARGRGASRRTRPALGALRRRRGHVWAFRNKFRDEENAGTKPPPPRTPRTLSRISPRTRRRRRSAASPTALSAGSKR